MHLSTERLMWTWPWNDSLILSPKVGSPGTPMCTISTKAAYALSQEEFFNQLRADDLHVANDLIHMDGTKVMGRWSDLTGTDYAGSSDEYILRYSQEFRGSFGHVGLLGVDEFSCPSSAAPEGRPTLRTG